MVVLTRSISAATSWLRRSMVAGERLSNGTTTAKTTAPKAPECRTGEHRNAMVTRQVRPNAHLRERAGRTRRTDVPGDCGARRGTAAQQRTAGGPGALLQRRGDDRQG